MIPLAKKARAKSGARGCSYVKKGCARPPDHLRTRGRADLAFLLP